MPTQRLGIIMNGVTGRMGINQHLIRSILAIRKGGVRLADGERVMPDPILVGRNAEKIEAAGKAATSHAGPPTSTRRSRTRTTRCSSMPRRRRCAVAAAAGDRRRQARLLREAGRDQARRGDRGPRLANARASSTASFRTSCSCPACASSDAARLRVFRPDAVGARRVRLLGVRGRLAGRAAPVLELPQRGRRRHHPRHDVPLALRARQPVRRGQERELSRRHAHPPALGRGASPTRRRPTMPPTRRSSSKAA